MSILHKWRQRSSSTPAVLFVDETPWESFYQLAASAHQAGLRTLWVSTRPQSRIASRLFFDRSIYIPSASELQRLPDMLEDEYIADVHVVEKLARQTYDALYNLPTSRGSNFWTNRMTIIDKLQASRLIRKGGLKAPEAFSTKEISARSALHELGSPLLLKPRFGSSGEGISIVETVEQLEDCLRDLNDIGNWFLEQYVGGTAMTVTGLATDTGIGPLVVSERLRAECDGPFGPATSFRFHEDRELKELIEHLSATIKLRGLFDIDVIRDKNSRIWIHDINLRISGTISAIESAGIDLLRSYTDWLTGRIRGQDAPPIQIRATEALVFPAALPTVLSAAGKWTSTLRAARWLLSFRAIFGVRYLIFQLLRQDGRFLQVIRLTHWHSM